MSTKIHSEIINSLDRQNVARNERGDFWEIHSPCLAIDAKLNGPLMFGKQPVTDKYLFEGWYRLFDNDGVGDLQHFSGGFQQSVSSEDEARLYLLNMAVCEHLIEPREEEYQSKGAAPFRLGIVSATPSFLEYVVKVINEDDGENLSDREATTRRNLLLLRSVDVCPVSREAIHRIAAMESVRP